MVIIFLAAAGCGRTPDGLPSAGDAPSGLGAPQGADGAEDLDAPRLVDGTTPSSCTVPVSFGVVVARSPSAARELGPPVDLNYVDPLNGDPQPDVFTLVLVDGRGAFASGGIAPKTIQLGGVEAAYATCGGCVEIFSDVNAQGNFAAFYLASSGTLTITAVSPRLTGTLSTVTLVHLDDNDVVVDACTTRIDSLAFDVPISP